MKVNIILTHTRGRSINVHRLEQQQIFAGDLIVYLAAVQGLRRASRTAALRPLARSLGEHVLPDLHDVELIAFGERAMMLNGFEEVDGSRYYQGWWVRWEVSVPITSLSQPCIQQHRVIQPRNRS